MKKVLGFIFGLLFLFSMLISKSDNLKNKIIRITSESKYASTIIPVPKYIQVSNLANDEVINKKWYQIFR